MGSDEQRTFLIPVGVSDLLTTIELKLISLATQSNSWANILAQVSRKRRVTVDRSLLPVTVVHRSTVQFNPTIHKRSNY